MSMLGMGQALPPGFVSQPFNCPVGSDFAASQEVGMCVRPDYDPVYTLTPGGAKIYYNLDGSLAGFMEKKTGSLFPGVPNLYLYVGAALFLLMYMLPVRRR